MTKLKYDKPAASDLSGAMPARGNTCMSGTPEESACGPGTGGNPFNECTGGSGGFSPQICQAGSDALFSCLKGLNAG